MAYNANIPQPTDAPSNSQPLILGNFQAIESFVGVNHGTFDSVTIGKHKFVTFPVQAAAPVFLAGETGLYNKNYATTAKNESYIHTQTFAGTSDIPFSASIMSTATPGNQTDGWTYLPSGILMHWSNIAGNGSSVITVNPAYPAFSAIFTVLLTGIDPAVGDSNTSVRLVNILSNTQYTVYFSSRTALGAAAGNARALIIGR